MKNKINAILGAAYIGFVVSSILVLWIEFDWYMALLGSFGVVLFASLLISGK